MKLSEVRINAFGIQNYGTSGTTLLHSLLDGHPQILQMPGLLNREFFDVWGKIKNLAPDAAVTAYLDANRHFFEKPAQPDGLGLDRLGESENLSVLIDRNAFKSELISLLNGNPFTRKNLFISVYIAYAKATGAFSDEPNKFISFPVHSLPADQVLQLQEDFPDLKLVYMIRDPVASFVSSLSHLMALHRRNKVFRFNFLESTCAYMLCDTLRRNDSPHRTYGPIKYPFSRFEECVAVKLEQLHKEPEITMRALAAWLGLKWDDALLKSTFNGLKWWNRPESPKISGFGNAIQKSNRDKRVEFISNLDAFRISLCTFSKMRQWDYSNAVKPGILNSAFLILSLFVPFKFEFKGLALRCEQNFRIVRNFFYRNFGSGNVLKKAIFTAMSAMIAGISMPLFILRDYVMTRYWIIRSWSDEVFCRRHEYIRLLASP